MRIAILGSTGSIGTSALAVLRHQSQFKVQTLSTHRRLAQLCDQAKIHKPARLVVANQQDADWVKQSLGAQCPEVLYGDEGFKMAVTHEDTDWVINAMAGSSGLLPTFFALDSGKRVLLANKESLVSAGSLLMEVAHNNSTLILPIDSEHNAVLRCLPQDYSIGEDIADYGVRSIWLTASGGPFLDYSTQQLDQVKPQQACQHPNWSMGAKISVDSATLMNKGLELIEATVLFGTNIENINTVIHPQSIIHCLVEYCDGSFIAQLSQPDMKLAIHQALHYPNYHNYNNNTITPFDMKQLSFQKPDEKKFPCLQLAKQAIKQQGTALIALNAADNIAVHRFLANQIGFNDIPTIVLKTMQQFADHQPPTTLDEIIALDKQSSDYATEVATS